MVAEISLHVLEKGKNLYFSLELNPDVSVIRSLVQPLYRVKFLCVKHKPANGDLNLFLLMCSIWSDPNNASKWQIGFNSVFKGLINCWYCCNNINVFNCMLQSTKRKPSIPTAVRCSCLNLIHFTRFHLYKFLHSKLYCFCNLQYT